MLRHALLAALTAPLAAQEVGPPLPPGSAPPVELFDTVQLLVNNDCITHSDLLRTAWLRSQSGDGGGKDMQAQFRESMSDLIRVRLLTQAGHDLGYDPEVIQSYVRREGTARKERAGSATALAEALRGSRMDRGMVDEDTEDKVYRFLYERAITGEGAGPGGREYVDAYIRPGKLHLEFLRQGSSLDLPPVVHLQEIIVAPGAGEDLGSARQRAFLVRSRAVRGEDFAALNREFGVATKRVGNEFVHETDLDPIEEPRLASRPEVRDFVRTAKPGDISEPLPATVAGGQIGGWRLLRLVERVEGVAQRFEDREFQEGLTESLREARREYEIERNLRRLMVAAYVWPPPPARRPEGAGEPAPESGAVPEATPEVPPESAQPPLVVPEAAAPTAPPAIGAPENETSQAPAPQEGAAKDPSASATGPVDPMPVEPPADGAPDKP